MNTDIVGGQHDRGLVSLFLLRLWRVCINNDDLYLSYTISIVKVCPRQSSLIRFGKKKVQPPQQDPTGPSPGLSFPGREPDLRDRSLISGKGA